MIEWTKATEYIYIYTLEQKVRGVGFLLKREGRSIMHGRFWIFVGLKFGGEIELNGVWGKE